MKFHSLFSLLVFALLWVGCGGGTSAEEAQLQEEITELESMATSLDSTAATLDAEVDSLEIALKELEGLFSDQENQ